MTDKEKTIVIENAVKKNFESLKEINRGLVYSYTYDDNISVEDNSRFFEYMKKYIPNLIAIPPNDVLNICTIDELKELQLIIESYIEAMEIKKEIIERSTSKTSKEE